MSKSSTQLVTSGGRRGCGYRQPGGAYVAVPLGPGGRPIEGFLIDPPHVLGEEDRGKLGLCARGVKLIDRDGVTHVYDIVGREHYPTVRDFVDEARRMGVSRRVAARLDFARITRDSRLVLLHEHADVSNAPEFRTERCCPCGVDEHLRERFGDMCVRLWWDEPLAGAQHRLAIFAVFPIPQIEVVRDPERKRHAATVKMARNAEVRVVEVDR